MNGQKDSTLLFKLKFLFFPNPIIKYLYYLRKAEYYTNVKSPFNQLFKYYYLMRIRKLGLKTGFSIPINVFGPGLALPHIGPVIVNRNASIGKNCRLHVCTNIGASGGNKEAPCIGDNVYIGPSAVLFGGIHIGNNVTIGANATVNRSFSNENVVIAGTPAKVVKENYPNWVEFNKLLC
jgi:serine O-acetyltransferase